MTTRPFRRVRAVCALAACALAACAPSGPRPRIVLVTFDTTRADRLGAWGCARPTSPHLDALAARGARFAAAWSHAPETGPSLATVLTSRRAAVTGVRGNAERLDAALPTLATAAHDAGLPTAAFVSTVLLRRDGCGFDRGFGVYDDEMTDACFGHDGAQRIARRTADRAVAWLRENAGPAFCWVHLYDPHGPYTPPEPEPRLDATRSTLASSPLRAEWIASYQRVGDSLDAADYADRYDREIAYADAQFARIAEAAGPGAIVMVHADHGESLGEDGYWFRHGSLLHDAALRVPWIVAGPGVPAGRVIDGDVRLIDLAPTLLSLAGLPPLPDAEGDDLAACVRDGRAPPGSPLVAEAQRREIVRIPGIDTRWKIRVRAAGADATFLAGIERPPAALAPLVAAWLAEPPRPAVAKKPPAARDAAADRALESLGYK